jgi:release factor glutamine methyltransferase
VTDQTLPAHERRRLLSLVTGEPVAESYEGMQLTDRQTRRYELLTQRRLAGEPLQYLEGTVDFGPLTLAIDRRALIPRPETEQLWELVRDEVTAARRSPRLVVDLCTGSGALALALKYTFPTSVVMGTDLSSEALRLAEENGYRTRLEVVWREGDLLGALPLDVKGHVDVLVANPPYVGLGEWLPMEVREHEPSMALYAGPDGTEALAEIAEQAIGWLSPGGLIACEIGERQGDVATRLFSAYGAVVRKDLAGRPRFVVGRAPSS